MASQLVRSRYLAASPALAVDGIAAHVVFSTRSQRAMVVASWIWQAIESDRLEEVPADMVRELADAEILVTSGSDELAEVVARSRQAGETPTILYECIQPSATCNLGCGYCGQAHTSRLLSEADQDAIVRRVRSKLRRDYRMVRIGWFGGEPLAGLGVIRSLTGKLRALCAEQERLYDAHMVTNGLSLTPAVADEVIGCLAVSEIEITLDGPAPVHDRRRHTKAGQPTFDRILANLCDVAERWADSVRLVVRCNVDRSNAEQVPALIALLAERGLQDRVELYFAPIHDWGNEADRQSLDPQDYADREIEWLALSARLGFRPALVPTAKPLVCMAVNPHAELIDPYGQVFNCSEAPLVPAYGNPNVYAMGTLAEPRASAAAAHLSDFLDDVAESRMGCSRCPMLPVCGGACPKQWRDGRVPCPSAKRNLPERLMLALALSRIAA